MASLQRTNTKALTKTAKGPSETQIQAAILEYLHLRKIMAWRCQAIAAPIRRGNTIVGLRRANPETIGIPDILGVIRGRLFAIEVKTSVGRPSPAQLEWKEKLERNGALWTIARSVDEAIAFIDKNFKV